MRYHFRAVIVHVIGYRRLRIDDDSLSARETEVNGDVASTTARHANDLPVAHLATVFMSLRATEFQNDHVRSRCQVVR